MILELTLRKLGDSVGMVLPEEALALLKAGEGDSIRLTGESDGALRIVSIKAEAARQMEAAEEIIRRYPETLRELAK